MTPMTEPGTLPTIDPAELYPIACTTRVLDGPVRGMCWQPLPCPVHLTGVQLVDLTDIDLADVDLANSGGLVVPVDEPAARRRMDRCTAVLVGVTAAAAFGTYTGRLAGLRVGLPSERVGWLIAAGLAAGGVAAVVVVLLGRWLREVWRWRHHRLLGNAAGLGWDLPTDIEGGVPDER